MEMLTLVLGLLLLAAIRKILSLYGELRDLRIYVQGVQDGATSGKVIRDYSPFLNSEYRN